MQGENKNADLLYGKSDVEELKNKNDSTLNHSFNNFLATLYVELASTKVNEKELKTILEFIKDYQKRLPVKHNSKEELYEAFVKRIIAQQKKQREPRKSSLPFMYPRSVISEMKGMAKDMRFVSIVGYV